MKQKAMQVFVFSSSASSSSSPHPQPCHRPTLPLREQTAANWRQSPPADREDWMQISNISVGHQISNISVGHLEEFAGHGVLHPVASNLQHSVWPRSGCSPCQQAAAQRGAGPLGPRSCLQPAGLARAIVGQDKQARRCQRTLFLGQLDPPGGGSGREGGGGG